MVSSVIIMGVIILGAKYLPTNDPEYKVESTATTSVSAKDGFVAALPFIFNRNSLDFNFQIGTGY